MVSGQDLNLGKDDFTITWKTLEDLNLPKEKELNDGCDHLRNWHHISHEIKDHKVKMFVDGVQLGECYNVTLPKFKTEEVTATINWKEIV
jgi:hypothetical protein